MSEALFWDWDDVDEHSDQLRQLRIIGDAIYYEGIRVAVLDTACPASHMDRFREALKQ